MPRRPRLNLSSVPQHIIQRGNNRQATFFADADYLFYLECLRDAMSKYGCRLHAYVLMTNHVHLLMSGMEPHGISRTMQHLGRRFVRYINHTYRRSGTLWEGRFKASLVDTEAYFLRCCRYIECNPVRAGMVADPLDYRWCSHRAHALGISDQTITLHEQYLRLGRTDEERCQAYRSLFGAALESTELHELRDAVNRGWPYGSERFKDEIECVLVRGARPPKRGRPARRTEEDGIGTVNERLF